MDDYIELSFKGQAGGLRRAILGDGGGRGGSFRGGRGRGFGADRGGGRFRGRGGFGGRGRGGFPGGRGGVTRKAKQKCALCKERGHLAANCPYSEEDAKKKKVAALQKHVEMAVAAAKAAADATATSSSSSTTSSTTYQVAHLRVGPPQSVMPSPSLVDADENMID